MEFLIDGPNVQIKHYEKYNPDTLDPILINKYSSNNISLKSMDFNLFYKIDFTLQLNDFYLINNIKIFNLPELNKNNIILSQITFSYPDIINSNNNNKYKIDIPFYYNPDKSDIITIQNNEISIFCVGTTNQICLSFLIRKNIEINEIITSKKYINKFIIYSQYIYSIPNATFLMTLLNLKNYFYNLKNNKNISKEISLVKIKDNYFCSMYLTAISMIQARLYIQSWEMLTNLQNEILSFNSENNLHKNNFLKILFEINNKKNNEKKIYLTKLELIKGICMFEHGNIQIFLSCLRNCINIFYNNKYVVLSKNISLSKINETAQDKIYIQSFLEKYGIKIVDILITFLDNKNEMMLYSVLKIFEFFIDYNPEITYKSLDKVVYFLFKINYNIYYYKKKINNNTNNPLIQENENNNNIINNTDNNNNLLEKIFINNGLLFPYDLYKNFNNNQKNSNINNNNNNSRNNSNDSIYKYNSISQVLQKQINYTLDTIIQNINNYSPSVINSILKTCTPFLFEIINNNDKETLIYASSVKLLKKCYENSSSNLYYLNYQNLLNLFIFGIKPSLLEVYKEYIKLQNTTYNNNKDLHLNKKLKENIKFNNIRNNYLSILLNTNALIENNDYGNLITIIFDRINDIYLNDFNENSSVNYLNQCINYIRICLECFSQNTDNKDIEFIIFYLYLSIEFLIIIYFPNSKNDIKKAIISFYLGKKTKNNLVILNKINELITILFELEKITLINISSYILFEPILEILSRIKFLYKTNNDCFPLYDKFFLDQYELLAFHISNKGINYDNIKYLLKTLPLIENEDENFNIVFRKIFSIFLLNIDNYYNEESFNLFSLSMEKISNFIDENLFEDITTAILNKSNYKGKIFNQCYNKYYEIIINNNNYFNYFIQGFINCLNDYKNEMVINKGDKIMFKTKFIDRIELIKKFFAYLKTNNKINILKFLIFNRNDLLKLIIDYLKILNALILLLLITIEIVMLITI